MEISDLRDTITDIPLEDRIRLNKYHHEECYAAIRGEKIPNNLGVEITRLCAIRGTRYHPGFGTELYALQNPMFNRALNARTILSNSIPDMPEPGDIPYCIWHPDIASESTYRELASRYPQMRYSVGRACAVAGYVDLYRELNLLPEISIAEEARESGETGRLIFEDIMKQPIRYKVLDDYVRSANLDTPRAGAHLNGDTAVRCLLEIKQKLPWKQDDMFFKDYSFNLTEDWGMDEHTSHPQEYRDVIPWLYTPLPLDLPTVHKELLILMAAFYGDVDRYVRLRRPKDCSMMEYQCIIRGVYHNTMFAKWMSLQPELDPSIDDAITARFIMNNDLSRITEEPPQERDDYGAPYQIWYPNWADASTYEELARRRPAMLEPAARACIVADYQSSYERLNPVPNYFLAEEAKSSRNKFYLEDLRKRGAEMGINVVDEYPYDIDDYKRRDVSRDCPPEHVPETEAPFSVTLDIINDRRGGWFDDVVANAGSLQLLVCLPEELKPTFEYPTVDVSQMYWQACRPGENSRWEEFPGGRHPRR